MSEGAAPAEMGQRVHAGDDWFPLAASQSATAVANKGSGAKGDFLREIWVVPTSVSPGAVTVTDNDGTAITVFAGGTNSVSTLHPFQAAWAGGRSRRGAWKIATGANLSIVAFGQF